MRCRYRSTSNVKDRVMNNGSRDVAQTPPQLDPMLPQLRGRHGHLSTDELLLRYMYGDREDRCPRARRRHVQRPAPGRGTRGRPRADADQAQVRLAGTRHRTEGQCRDTALRPEPRPTSRDRGTTGRRPARAPDDPALPRLRTASVLSPRASARPACPSNSHGWIRPARGASTPSRSAGSRPIRRWPTRCPMPWPSSNSTRACAC